MRTGVPDISDVSHQLAEFLLTYKSTPHTTTSRSPSELFIGRKIRTRLDSILPSCQSQVLRCQSQQKRDHDRSSHIRELCVTRYGGAETRSTDVLGTTGLWVTVETSY